MAKNIEHIQHIKSNVVENGGPKLPNPSALTKGEIAINYAEGVETISIKNSSGDIVTFSSDNYFINEKSGFKRVTNPTASTNVGLVNSLSQHYDTNIGKGAVIEGDGYEYNGTTYNIVASGDYSHAEGRKTSAIGNYSHTEGWGTIASGNSSHAEGNSSVANGNYSHAEGSNTTASGDRSHAEGYHSEANGNYSHAEGEYTKAYGDKSHTEGGSTSAMSQHSHAEGTNTTASGSASHAEGYYTEAIGNDSHAEGSFSKAIGRESHAEGDYTIANNYSEHASGRYNVSSSASTTFGDSGNTLFSVGNGNYATRHNAFEIRQNGDIYITSGGTDILLQDNLGGVVDQVIDSGTSASTNAVATKAVYDAITDNELVWAMAYTTLSGAVSSHTENSTIHVTQADKDKLHTHSNKSSLDSITGNVGTMAYEDKASYSSATEVNTALGNKANTSDIANFFDDAKYEDSGTTKVINFYHGNTIKATIDARDFIVDGMVDDVRIENGNLVIDFNTASGKQDISIPLTDIFDPSNYYNKTEIDDLVGSGFTSSSITEVIIENEEIISAALTDLDERKLDASAYTPTDLSNYYQKSETSGASEISAAFNDLEDRKAEKDEFDEQFETIVASLNDLEDRKAEKDEFDEQFETIAASLNDLENRKAEKSELSAITEYVEEIGETTAYALNDLECRKAEKDEFDEQFETIAASLNDLEANKASKISDLDGIKLKKITQSAYDALVQAGTVDSNTLYVITD